MTKPILFSHQYFSVALYGPLKTRRIRDLSQEHQGNPDSVCLVKAASDATHPGFMQINEPVFGSRESDDFDIYTDGVILTQYGSSAIIQTADCPTIVMYEHISRRLLVVHAGRYAMTPQNKKGEKIDNIVTRAYSALTAGMEYAQVSACIVGSICGRCFQHEDEAGQKLVEPFDQFGQIAFSDRKRGSLNLRALITTQLVRLGVSFRNIDFGNECTYEDPELASFRRDKTTDRNAVVAVLHW